MDFERWTVVVVPFPFTDRARVRRRPAVVVSRPEALAGRVDHSVLAMVTSALNPSWPLDVRLHDQVEAGQCCHPQGRYAVVTLHRPSNVDDRSGLETLVRMLLEIARRVPVVFPVHARTHERLAEFGFQSALRENESVILTDPLGYLDFLGLLAKARLDGNRWSTWQTSD